MAVTLRWLFALAAVVCGAIVLVKASGSTPEIATGVGLIAAGVGLISP